MNKKIDTIGIIGLLLAIFTIAFGDNVYEQVTGRSIFPSSATSSVITPTTPSFFTTMQSTETPNFSEVETQTQILASEASPSEITDTKGAQMVLISGGSFVMGSNNAEHERPIHDVYLNAFYIDKYEVTNDMFVEFLHDVMSDVVVESNGDVVTVRYKGAILALCPTCGEPYKDKLVWNGSRFEIIPPFNDHPVVSVSWYGARNYCEWRGARLLTEAEWEKAAHGTDNRTYPWGEKIDCTKSNYSFSCVGGSSAVGSFKADISPYGVYDMAGNAEEWVADWYSDSYYLNSPYENPLGPETGIHRVFRGGTYFGDENSARTTYRISNPPDIFDTVSGIRCARDAHP